MSLLEKLLDRLYADLFPRKVIATFDPANTPNGISWVILDLDGKSVEIEWLPVKGFGASLIKSWEEDFFATQHEQYFNDITEAQGYIIRLLST